MKVLVLHARQKAVGQVDVSYPQVFSGSGDDFGDVGGGNVYRLRESKLARKEEDQRDDGEYALHWV